MTISIAIARETTAGEKRVAMVPRVSSKLAALDVQLTVARDAGEASRIPDAAYGESVTISDQADDIASAQIVLAINAPDVELINRMAPGSVLVCQVQGHTNPRAVEALQKNRVTCFAMERIPRISRSQSMDVLSSQASAAGYKAAVMAANALDRFFPMLTTAAGTIRPARVLVIGAGVAGLQAIATAGRLGAKVYGYDVRTDTREQVESLGAEFLMAEGVKAEAEGGYARALSDEEKDRQQQMLTERMAEMDAVITTAAIPGHPAPKIISRTMVEGMKTGAVVIDLAAAGGGNCELTRPDEVVTHGSITIHGPSNMPSLMAEHASEMYAQNLLKFLQLIMVPTSGDDSAGKEAELEVAFDWDDEILARSVLTHDGNIFDEAARQALGQAAPEPNDEAESTDEETNS